MKLTKTFALAALVAGSLFAGTALQAKDSTTPPAAGDKPHGGHGAHNRPKADRMAWQLCLTDDQVAKIKPATEDLQKQIKTFPCFCRQNPEERTKIKELRKAYQEKMKEILTAEQYNKWQKLMTHKPHKTHKTHNRPTGGAGNGTPAKAPPQQ